MSVHARPPAIRRPSRLCAAAAAAFAVGLFGSARCQEVDPNLQAVNAVCGRCHAAAQFMDKPRAWERWNDVFRQMMRIGATGTDEQFAQVTSYFLDHLTTLNVNTGTVEELTWVLNISDEVAQDLIVRRQRQRFTSLAQVGAVPGVNRERLDQLKRRIEF